MRTRAILISILLIIMAMSFPFESHAQTLAPGQTIILSPYKDYAMTATPPVRNADGTTKRDPRVIAAYRKLYPCPSTGLKTGACKGWALDHTRPLDCGGVDAVWNLTWMPDAIKSAPGPNSKDHYERKIYGGKGISPGCP